MSFLFRSHRRDSDCWSVGAAHPIKIWYFQRCYSVNNYNSLYSQYSLVIEPCRQLFIFLYRKFVRSLRTLTRYCFKISQYIRSPGAPLTIIHLKLFFSPFTMDILQLATTVSADVSSRLSPFAVNNSPQYPTQVIHLLPIDRSKFLAPVYKVVSSLRSFPFAAVRSIRSMRN